MLPRWSRRLVYLGLSGSSPSGGGRDGSAESGTSTLWCEAAELQSGLVGIILSAKT